MSRAFVVAVSQRVDVLSDRGERRDALDQRLCEWLTVADFVPVPVPNLMSPLVADELGFIKWVTAINPDAFVLSGGNDIGDAPERDHTEKFLLTWASEQRKPVLGICRGMQMMSVWSGGKLIQVPGHVRSRHHLNAMAPGWPSDVNSFHNLALGHCPAGFKVTARAEDGIIEAMRHESVPWEGWMWHPERETDFNLYDIQRLRMLFK